MKQGKKERGKNTDTKENITIRQTHTHEKRKKKKIDEICYQNTLWKNVIKIPLPIDLHYFKISSLLYYYILLTLVNIVCTS